MGKHQSTLEERFWKKVDRRADGECWPWKGATIGKEGYQYGEFHLSSPPQPRIKVLAHRYSWELAHGRKPGEWMIRHTCHNPACVNPAHLKRGKQRDNMQDMKRAGRQGRGGYHKGEAVPNHKLTEEQVREIRRLVDGGAIKRQVAIRFRVHPTLISRIAKRLAWPHLP